MSTPYGGNDKQGSDESADRGEPWPPYEPTDHPEDRPEYGDGNRGAQGTQDTQYPGTQHGNPYREYNAGSGLPSYGNEGGYGSGIDDYYPGDATRTAATPDIFESIRWGFAATFRNFSLWILGALAFFAVAALLGFGAGFVSTSGEGAELAFQIITAVISCLFMPVVYSLILHQLDHQDTGWGHIGKSQNYGPTLLIYVIMQLISMVAVAIPSVLIVLQNRELLSQQVVSDADLTSFFLTIFAVFAVVMVLALLVGPFFFSLIWLVADKRAGVGEAFKASFAIGRDNYLKLLGLSVLSSIIITVIAVVTLGLGLLVATPAMQLAAGHFYRQVAGGQIPAESRRY